MSPVRIRRAAPGDLAEIVALLADDGLGRGREDARLPLDGRYVAAFAAIEADPNQLPVVAVDEAAATRDGGRGALVGYLQLTFVPGLSRKGMWRGQIESVRVAVSRRGQGVGSAMIAWAVDQARARGCGLVQLTSDKVRADAHRFYGRLGFVASHDGFKLSLDGPGTGPRQSG